jgi:acid phosphatase (class A)
MQLKSILAGAAALAGLAGAAAMVGAQTGPAPFLDPGYLTLVDVVPPAPIPQEPKGVADRDVYKATRALAGSQRWTMAVDDQAGDAAAMMRAFGCAARVSITPQTAPRTAALIERASRDAVREANELRAYYKRRRLLLTESGPTCVTPDDSLRMSYDYPSADATRGWTWALILSEILHERAAPIMARGRAYGESGVVCGTHSMSAVEAGRLTASATLNIVRTEQAYADGVVAARSELAALQRSGAAPSAQVCAAEELLVTEPIFR